MKIRRIGVTGGVGIVIAPLRRCGCLPVVLLFRESEVGLEVGVGFVGSRFCTPLSVGSGKEGCCLDKCYPSSDLTCVGDGIVADY